LAALQSVTQHLPLPMMMLARRLLSYVNKLEISPMPTNVLGRNSRIKSKRSSKK
jgi:hypothetical protein